MRVDDTSVILGKHRTAARRMESIESVSFRCLEDRSRDLLGMEVTKNKGIPLLVGSHIGTRREFASDRRVHRFGHSNASCKLETFSENCKV